MAIKIIIPSLGLTMEEAVIAEWIKSEGDEVLKDEPILLIETDKATHEVTAPSSGILRNIAANVGDVIPVGDTVAEILSAEESAGLVEGDKQPVITAAPSLDIKADTLEEPRKPMDFYETDDAEIEIYTAPVQVQVTASLAQSTAGNEVEILRASPAARKKARELNADLQRITGSGPQGRIIEGDVVAFVGLKQQLTPATAQINRKSPHLTKPLSKMRKIIAERMVASRQATASVTLFANFRMDEAVELRRQMNQTLEKRPGHKITFDAIFAKAATLVLAEFPDLQAQWSEEGLRHVGAVHIGIAVALPEGLVVPVVQNMESRSLFSAAKEINLLADKAKQGKLTADEMQGGTFTVSNLGMYPIGGFTPVINLPEAAILGIGGISEQAVVDNGVIEIGKVAEISLTFDHRITDGAPAAAFLSRLKALIEEPYQLFMEL